MSTNANSDEKTRSPPTFSFTTHPSVAKFAVPMKQYLEANPQFDGLVVGALVYDAAGRLLLLQRAAHDSMPSRWEVPGGACDWEDETILHAAARELWEESGLTPRRLGRIVRCGAEDGVVFFSRRQRRYCKYSFEVEVEGYEVTLDPNEHQAFVWASEDECRAHKAGDAQLRFTTWEQEESIMEGFRMRKEVDESAPKDDSVPSILESN